MVRNRFNSSRLLTTLLQLRLFQPDPLKLVLSELGTATPKLESGSVGSGSSIPKRGSSIGSARTKYQPGSPCGESLPKTCSLARANPKQFASGSINPENNGCDVLVFASSGVCGSSISRPSFPHIARFAYTSVRG